MIKKRLLVMLTTICAALLGTSLVSAEINNNVNVQPSTPTTVVVPAPAPTVVVDEDDDDNYEHGEGVTMGIRAAYLDPADLDAEWFPGFQLRLFASPALALEGSFDYRHNDLGSGAELHTYPVQATLLLYLLAEKDELFNPFLLAGAGWYYTTLEIPGQGDDTDSRFGLHAGAGLEYILNRYWSIDGTYRYIWIEDISSNSPSLVKKDFNDDGHMVTIGLNYKF